MTVRGVGQGRMQPSGGNVKHAVGIAHSLQAHERAPPVDRPIRHALLSGKVTPLNCRNGCNHCSTGIGQYQESGDEDEESVDVAGFSISKHHWLIHICLQLRLFV